MKKLAESTESGAIEAQAGIRSMSALEYQNDAVSDTPSLSASIAKILVNESPLHAWTAHPRLNPDFQREEKEIFDLGTVAHALMLQGLRAAHIIRAVNKDGEPVSDWRTKAAKEERDSARLLGRIPILEHQWKRIETMVEAGKLQIAVHKEACDVFTDAGKPEQSITWTDDHGVVCRSRLDWLRNDFKRIADYKGTGTSVNPEGLSRFAVSQGWDVQAAFYRRGIKKIAGIDSEFLFVAQEDTSPYALTVVGMGPDFAWAGEQKVQQAIDTWAKCMESGKWPCYPTRICYPVLPSYEETKITERQLREV